MEIPKVEQLKSEESQEDFNEKIAEQLDFLLEATNIEDTLDRIGKCEKETDNTMKECFKDTLMPIRQGLLMTDFVCKKYEKNIIAKSNFVNLKEKYEELKNFTDKITKEITIEDIRLMISDSLVEMNGMVADIKEEQFYREAIETHIDNIFKATELEQALKELHECKKRTRQDSVELCFTDFITMIDYNIQAMNFKRSKREEKKELVISDEDINKITKSLEILKIAFVDVRKDKKCSIDDAEEIIASKLKNLRDIIKEIGQKLK